MKNDLQTGNSIWRRRFLTRNAPSLILCIALILGLFIWAADAALDYFVFYEGGFLELLLLKPPQHEIYIRFLILLCFLGFGGVVSEVVLNFQDTLNELQSKETNLRTTLQSIGDAVIATDTSGRIQRMNERSESLTGWGVEEAQGLPLEQVFPIVNAISRESVANPVRRVLEEGTIQGLANHTMLIAKDGTEYQIADSASPIRNDEGSITGVVLVFRDVTEQYRQEEFLRKQRRRLANVVEGTDAGIWERDIQSMDLFFDTSWLQHLGYDPDEFSEMELYTWRQLLHPEDLEKSDRLIAKHLSGHLDAYECEIRVMRKDGSWAWVLDRGKVTEHTSDGEPFLLSGTVQDVTERKRSEEALQESQRQLATLMGNLPGMAYRCLNDPCWTMLFLSEGCRELTGYSPEDLVENRIGCYADLIRPEDEDRVWKEVQQGLEQSGRYEVEYRIHTAEGEEKHVWEQGTGVYEDEQLVFLEGFITDITERKSAEERNRFLSTILENLYDSVIVTDSDFQITYVNKETEELFGYKLEEIQGSDPLIFYSEPVPEKIQRNLYEVVTKGQTYYGEGLLKRKDGSTFVCDFKVMALMADDGTPYAYVGINKDITDRKRAEEERAQEVENQQILLNNIRTQIWYMTDERTYGIANQAHAEFQGFTPKDVSFKDLYDILPEDVAEICRQSNNKVFVTGQSVSTEEWFPYVSGEWRLLSILKTPKLRDDGTVEYVVCSAEDITERKQMEAMLRQSENYYRTIFETSGTAMCIFGPDTTISLVNSNFEQLSGYSRQEVEGEKSWIDFVHPEDMDWMKENHYLALQNSDKALNQYEFRCITRYGEVRNLFLVADFIPVTNQTIISCIDITERKQMEQKLEEMSLYDSLTGLYNRNFFDEEMKRLSDGRNNPLGIIVCDLDGLKFINDTLGHQHGDQILMTIAAILRQNFRNSDIIARIGGDEFAVLIPQVPRHAVEQKMQTLRQAVLDYNNSDPEIPISFSLGYAVSEGETADMQAIFREADNRMYREKIQREGSARSAILQALTGSMQARDFDTEGHCERLQELVASLGRSLELSQDLMNDLFLLARFHDLGKVGISDNILFKQSPLSEEECREMRQHCEIGHRIARSVPDLEPIADYILKHHEWWDGRGYPLGLSGEDIPLLCRILAIADAYDAITSARPYRKAMSQKEAIEELRRSAGTQFDPELVERFIRILEESQGG